MPDAGARHEVLDRGLLHLEVLDVGGDDDHARSSRRLSDPDGLVDDELRLHGRSDRHDVLRDVLEQTLHVELLLEVAARGHTSLLTDDRDDRLVVAVRVVQAVHEVHGARPRRRHADPDLARELGVRGRHQRGHLLMRGPDVAEVLVCLLRPAQGTVETADPVPGIAVEAVEVPLDQSVDDEVADAVHKAPLPWISPTPLTPSRAVSLGSAPRRWTDGSGGCRSSLHPSPGDDFNNLIGLPEYIALPRWLQRAST